jgi:hypothetical protein
MEASIFSVAVGFASGVTLVGALATSLTQSARERQRRLRQARTDIYHRLMMLRTMWWSMVLGEGHKEQVSRQVRREIHDTAWRLADALRLADDMDDLESIVAVLFSESFDTAYDRYKAMDHIVNHLGQRVNPKYLEAVEKVSSENMRRGMGELDRMFSAPCSLLH